jgi:hypothetical protein
MVDSVRVRVERAETDDVARPRLMRRLFGVVRLLCTWGLAAILAYAAVGAGYYCLVRHSGKRVVDYEVYRGYLRVGVEGQHELRLDEGAGKTTFGAHGMIVNKQVDPRRPRLLFIGDSYVEAAQVSDARKFTEIVERTWNSRHADRPVQSINMGQGGLDMRAYISFGRDLDAYLNPDLVFVVVKEDDFRALAQAPQLLERLDENSTGPLLQPARELSAFENLVNELGQRDFFVHQKSQLQALSKMAWPARLEESSIAPAAEIQPEAISAQLLALQDIWQERLVLVYHSHVTEWMDGNYDVPLNRVAAQASWLGIPVIDLDSALIGAYQRGTPPKGFHNTLLGDGHWNHLGHELVADEIISYIELEWAGGER